MSTPSDLQSNSNPTSHPTSKPSTRVPSRFDQLGYRATQLLHYPLVDRYRKMAEAAASKTADQVVNCTEIRAVGLRRTGNHAVLNWIASQQAGAFFHLNNVAAGTNPYRYKRDNLRRYHPGHDKMVERYGQQAKGKFVKRDCLIHSYEDWALWQVTQRKFERNRSLYLGKSARQIDMLILRDPFNLFASRLKKGYIQTKAAGASMVEVWLEYAREFVEESHYLQAERIFVNYNRWFAEEDYRRHLSARLGLNFSDEALAQVPEFGGGSSFRGTQVNGRSLDITNRWQAFSDDPTYRVLFENEAVWAYSEQIFGHIPGTESLRDCAIA